MSRVIDSSNRSQRRRDARFPAMVGVTALVAAASTALCMHIGVPAWGMFAGWIVFVTGGGGAKAGLTALGSALLGLVLGLGGGAAIAGAAGGLGNLAVPVVVFAIVALAMLGQLVPLFNSVISYFLGMTVYFASSLPPGPATLATLGSAVAIGALSGLAAAALGRLIEAAPDGSR